MLALPTEAESRIPAFFKTEDHMKICLVKMYLSEQACQLQAHSTNTISAFFVAFLVWGSHTWSMKVNYARHLRTKFPTKAIN